MSGAILGVVEIVAGFATHAPWPSTSASCERIRPLRPDVVIFPEGLAMIYAALGGG